MQRLREAAQGREPSRLALSEAWVLRPSGVRHTFCVADRMRQFHNLQIYSTEISSNPECENRSFSDTNAHRARRSCLLGHDTHEAAALLDLANIATRLQATLDGDHLRRRRIQRLRSRQLQ
jgi:hypothetical protein